QAMVALETQGAVIRGHFSHANINAPEVEWCERRLLARIHRQTLDRLRREIEPVSAADYLRFLFAWQHVAPDTQLQGEHGVREAVAQLQGLEIPAVAW